MYVSFNIHPLDWPLTLFSANLMSAMSLTPSRKAKLVRSLSDVHYEEEQVWREGMTGG